MNPKIWGPHAWFFLYSVALGYSDNPTEEEKLHIKNLYQSLPYTLPCDMCKKGLKDDLIKHPLTDDVLINKERLIRWLINIHNETNIKTNTPLMTYETVINKYINNRDERNSKLFSRIHTCATMLLVVVIMIMLYRNLR